jgi:hypothetical protein
VPEEPLTTPGAISPEPGELGVELVVAGELVAVALVPVVAVALVAVVAVEPVPFELPHPASSAVAASIEASIATNASMRLASDRTRLGLIADPTLALPSGFGRPLHC